MVARKVREVMLTRFGEGKDLHGLAVYTDLEAPSRLARQGQAVLVQPFPEDRDAIQHLVAETDEGVLVERALEIQPLQLFLGVLRVLGLQARVPGEEGEREVLSVARIVALEVGDELVPETGGGPVLDGVARGLGDEILRAAVEPDQLVAEEKGRRVPWRRLPTSLKPSERRSAICRSHSKCAARKRNTPPSTVPSEDTNSGSVSPPLPEETARLPPALKTTPISLARISFEARMPWSESALMVLKSWATRNRLENTENCTIKSRTCSRVCSPRLNQAVYGFPVMMRWCSNSLSMRLCPRPGAPLGLSGQ